MSSFLVLNTTFWCKKDGFKEFTFWHVQIDITYKIMFGTTDRVDPRTKGAEDLSFKLTNDKSKKKTEEVSSMWITKDCKYFG